jgi:hypothetical protein
MQRASQYGRGCWISALRLTRRCCRVESLSDKSSDSSRFHCQVLLSCLRITHSATAQILSFVEMGHYIGTVPEEDSVVVRPNTPDLRYVELLQSLNMSPAERRICCFRFATRGCQTALTRSIAALVPRSRRHQSANHLRVSLLVLIPQAS